MGFFIESYADLGDNGSVARRLGGKPSELGAPAGYRHAGITSAESVQSLKSNFVSGKNPVGLSRARSQRSQPVWIAVRFAIAMDGQAFPNHGDSDGPNRCFHD